VRKFLIKRNKVGLHVAEEKYFFYNYRWVEENVPNVVAECLTFLPRIREVPGSYIGPEIGNTDWGFSCYPQFLQANAGIVP
jgi:hypothetical protein